MARSTRVCRTAVAVALLWGVMVVGRSEAATCEVPSASYSTIQSAIDDLSCSDITVAAGPYVEALTITRSLSLQGAGSTQSFVQGGVEVSSGTVSLTGFHLSAAGEALHAHSGAEVSGFDLEVVNGVVETPLFADGFETGNTSAWSAASP
jgi:hypothetical protein